MLLPVEGRLAPAIAQAVRRDVNVNEVVRKRRSPPALCNLADQLQPTYSTAAKSARQPCLRSCGPHAPCSCCPTACC
eukprot:scaffold9336_cov133-Isochrysis_galbana.AAC.2